MLSLVERVAAAEATATEFLGRPLVWGETDCGKVIAANLVRLGLPDPLAEAPAYSDPEGARAVLRTLGRPTVKRLLDGLGFKRIRPLQALPSDVLAFPGRYRFPALSLQLTDGFVMAINPDGFWALGRVGLDEVEVVSAAWRVRVR